jgi:hypothetical protein
MNLAVGGAAGYGLVRGGYLFVQAVKWFYQNPVVGVPVGILLILVLIVYFPWPTRRG